MCVCVDCDSHATVVVVPLLLVEWSGGSSGKNVACFLPLSRRWMNDDDVESSQTMFIHHTII